jgi:hypothetical protein
MPSGASSLGPNGTSSLSQASIRLLVGLGSLFAGLAVAPRQLVLEDERDTTSEDRVIRR